MEGNIDETAAAWVVRMHSDQCTSDDALAFDTWLKQAPGNADAYADHLTLWERVGSLGSSDAAREVFRHEPGLHRRISPAYMRKLANVAAAVLVVAAVAFSAMPTSSIYKTAHGEQRIISLEDGSRITLNTDSRLRVQLQKSERRLVLEDGEAFFQVAKDAARPFRVFVGPDEVRAVGTAFEVRKDGSSAQVILEEGVVALYRGDNDAPLQETTIAAATRLDPAALLKPGQQARLAGPGPVMVTTADLSRAKAWREGRIAIENMSLAEAIAEVNRYGGPEIVLGDTSSAAFRVSGVFHAGHPEAFIEAIAQTFPLRAVADQHHRLVLIHTERPSPN